MPDEFGFSVQVLINGVPRIVVAIAARKNDDADSHSGSSQFTSPDRRGSHY
jgi:hypothetical protein